MNNEIDKVIIIDQSPIGKTPRSNPGTYIKAFDEIRNLFASTKEAKMRGYGPGRFSFNVYGGRCEKCQGDAACKSGKCSDHKSGDYGTCIAWLDC